MGEGKFMPSPFFYAKSDEEKLFRLCAKNV